jgi:hypothetical protein
MTKTTKPAAKKAAAPKTVKPLAAAITETTSHAPPAPPPADNAHVAPGAEQFDDPTDPRQQPAEPTAETGVFSLELARALPEVEFHAKALVFKSTNPGHVTKFGKEDGTLMQIVHVAGGLAAQPIEA